MPNRNLDRTWLYGGKFYGPGANVLVPDPLAARIDDVMGVETEAPPAPAPQPVASPVGRLSTEIMGALRKGGYTDADAISSASDDDLLRLRGIGPASLQQIREFYPQTVE